MMKKIYTTCIILASLTGIAWSQSPSVKWQKAAITAKPYLTETSDGSLGDLIDVSESLVRLLPTTDGGYMGLLTTRLGNTKSKLIKLSATGDTIFTKEIGLVSNIGGFAIFDMIVATDGGFIAVGSSLATGVQEGVPYEEFLSLRKYNDNGVLVWEEKFTGGYFIEQITKKLTAASITTAADGGYVIAAGSNNLAGNDKSEDTKGELDYWVIKTSSTGLIEWDKTIGGSRSDYPADIVNTKDGGYLVAGYSNSPASGDKSQGQKGGGDNNNDFWVVKIDENGSKVWDKTLGTKNTEYARLLVALPDGGFILAGDSDGGIDGDKTEANNATEEWDSQPEDTWVIKLNSDGNIVWQKSLGGRKSDVPTSAYVQADGSLVISISSNSPASASKPIAAFGEQFYDEPSGIYYTVEQADFWVVKLSPEGNSMWQSVLGGLGIDVPGAILPAQDGGIMVAGRSSSIAGSGNRTEANNAYNDVIYAAGSDTWIVVLDETTLPVSLLSFTGNLTGSGKALLQWKTSTEENFSHFELEKSTNLSYYSKVTSVAAKGNNSTYVYPDNVAAGVTYYRLKMLDKDGAVKYSNIVTINSATDAIITVAPNPLPAGSPLTVSMPPAAKNAYWQIIGIDGKLYGTQPIAAGTTQVKIDTKTLGKGNYVLLYGQGADRKIFRFIKN